MEKGAGRGLARGGGLAGAVGRGIAKPSGGLPAAGAPKLGAAAPKLGFGSAVPKALGKAPSRPDGGRLPPGVPTGSGGPGVAAKQAAPKGSARPKGSGAGALQSKASAVPKTGAQAKAPGALSAKAGAQQAKGAKAEEKKSDSAGPAGDGDEAKGEEEKTEWSKAEHTCWARQTCQPALAEFLDYWAYGVPHPQPEDEVLAEGIEQIFIKPEPMPDPEGDPAHTAWVAWEDPWFEENAEDEEGKKEEGKKEEGKSGSKQEKDKDKDKGKEQKKEKDVAKDGKSEKGAEDKKDGKDEKGEKTQSPHRGGAVVYVPKEPRQDVCAMWIHGGTFQFQSPSEDSYIWSCSNTAKALNMAVVMPDHLLSGEGRGYMAPTILWQLVTNINWLIWNDPATGKTRATPSSVILIGDSSGGTQAVSILYLLARHSEETLKAIPCLVLLSPAFDLTCRSHTYISNAYSEDHRTGDAFFTDGVEVTRAIFRDIGMWYAGSEEGLVDTIFSPYWLARWPDEELLGVLEKYRVPIWICIGAPEALCGEVLDFATRLRDRLPMEVWLHEGMFHCWILMRNTQQFYSRDAAGVHMIDFINRVVGWDPSTWPEKPVLKEGIHYYVDEWY